MKIQDYFLRLKQGFELLTYDSIEKVKDIIEGCDANIYIIGNGGSATTASHFAIDLSKNANKKAIALTNLGLLTALANDFNFADSYARQIKLFGNKNDILIIISVSGDSLNLVRSAIVAKRKGMNIICFTGFNGTGMVNKYADIIVSVNSENYEMVEDTHLAICHSIAQTLKIE